MFMFSTSLLLISHWVGRMFGSIDVAQIDVFLHNTMAGVDTRVIYSFIKNIILVSVAILAGLLLILRLAPRYVKFSSSRLPAVTLSAYLLLTLTYVTLKFDIISQLTATWSNFIEKHYTFVNYEDTEFPAIKKNLILILSESLENTFNDPTMFDPALMPELLELQKNNISFAPHHQLPGTDQTISGMTAYFFGIPLKLPIGDNNKYSRFLTFLPNASSILNILSQAGYDIQLISGANAKFAGQDNLFRTHAPEARVQDFSYFTKTRNDAINENGWGLGDYYIFDRARERLEEETKGDRPFFMIVQTIDAHANTFFIKDDSFRKYGDNRDVFVIQSKMIDDFVQWIKEQSFSKNTTIVVLGDHLLMQEDLAGVYLIDDHRQVFNMFINSSIMNIENNLHKPFSSIDMAPTILESIGVKLKQRRFGLGVSLFSNEKTLLERYEEKYLRNELKQKSQFYNKFY